MKRSLWRFCVLLHSIWSSDAGQDLVEYALLCSLIALSAIAGVSHVASAVTKVFSNVSTTLA
ncbi:MAG: hypothetical protein ABSD70_07085 [Terracidiphilus sp.]|jgi:Flp pilus assembly pilin Flp